MRAEQQVTVLTDPSLPLSLLVSWLPCRCRAARRKRKPEAAAPRRQAAAAAADTAPSTARRQAPEQPRGTVATSMASASASVVPPLIPLQKRRIRGISGVSSTESADSPTAFPGPTVFDTDVDRQADSVVKQEEADLQEDLALADSLNTALPGRHEDDEEVAATQQDGEEDAVGEGEEEEEMEERRRRRWPRARRRWPLLLRKEWWSKERSLLPACGHKRARVARYTRGRQQSQQQHLPVSSLLSPSPLDMPGNVAVF